MVGIKVLGGLEEADAHIRTTRPDEVLVTIPYADAEALDAVVEASAAAGIACRFVRREIGQPRSLLEASAE